MNKGKFIVWLALLAMAAVSLPADIAPVKFCCVAGEYMGSQVPDPLPNCPVPEKKSFTMTISQARGCGAELKLTVIDTSGHITEIKGTLSRGRGGCCNFTGSFSDPHPVGHVILLKGAFCKVMGRWQAKGTFVEKNSGDPCKKTGTWQIDQTEKSLEVLTPVE
jgi:hypothetical protein